MLGQGKLYKDAVYPVVAVENVYQIKKLLLSCGLVKSVLKLLEAYCFASLFLVVNITS